MDKINPDNLKKLLVDIRDSTDDDKDDLLTDFLVISYPSQLTQNS